MVGSFFAPLFDANDISFQNYLSPLRESKGKVVSSEDKVLAMCGQTRPISFDEYFDDQWDMIPTLLYRMSNFTIMQCKEDN